MNVCKLLRVVMVVMVVLSPVLFAAVSTASGPGASLPCNEFVARLPNMQRALCESARLQPSAARSIEGRTIWVRDIQPDTAAGNAAGNAAGSMAANPAVRVLVIGAIHGDELSSASLALHWIRLAGLAPVDAPQAVHWRFIPALNPDGLFSQPPRRVNARGVDLNRNFPTPNWAHEAKVYWEKRTRKDPRRYPGRTPLSEPESRFVHDEMQRFKPQLMVSIHAPYGVLDFDGPSVPPARLGRLYLDQVGIFPGSLGNYGGVHKGVPVVTIELPNSTRTPLDSEIRRMWLDLQGWMLVNLGPQR